jgi:hypothetical protein
MVADLRVESLSVCLLGQGGWRRSVDVNCGSLGIPNLKSSRTANYREYLRCIATKE